MGYILIFVIGVSLGVTYEKSIKVWKGKLEKAAVAANQSLKQ